MPGVPGPDAPAVGVGRAPAAVAHGDGLAVVAPTPAAEALGSDHGGDSSCGAQRRVERGGTGVLRPGRGGAGGHGPGQQRRGMHEQRLADAAVAASPDDAADARPEAALLELPAVPLGPSKRHLSLPGTRPGLANVRLLGVAPLRAGPIDARTVNPRDCRMRQSLPEEGTGCRNRLRIRYLQFIHEPTF